MPVFGGTPKQLIYNIDSIVSFSPDGSRFTYLQFTPERKDQSSEIHIANKDGSDNQVIYATREEMGPPAWSPRGDRIAWIGTIGPAKYALQIFEIASKKLTQVRDPAGHLFRGSIERGVDPRRPAPAGLLRQTAQRSCPDRNGHAALRAIFIR